MGAAVNMATQYFHRRTLKTALFQLKQLTVRLYYRTASK